MDVRGRGGRLFGHIQIVGFCVEGHLNWDGCEVGGWGGRGGGYLVGMSREGSHAYIPKVVDNGEGILIIPGQACRGAGARLQPQMTKHDCSLLLLSASLQLSKAAINRRRGF
jgi:hypothetical protein